MTLKLKYIIVFNSIFFVSLKMYFILFFILKGIKP